MLISGDKLTLQELNAKNFYDFCLLSVKEEQRGHVESNAISMAEANFSKHAWMRGISFDKEPVGFLMVDIQPELNMFYLWRLMIDQNYQAQGLGRAAIELLKNELKLTFDAKEITTSVVPGDDGPHRFYERLGFNLTGDLIEGRELELKLVIS